MASITITLPEHQRKWIEHEVESGRYESEASVITDAVQRAMERWEEDEVLLEAIAEYERDGGTPWTPELRERILRESEEAARIGDPIPYDVTY